jgi:hypothetical protein
MGGAVTAFLTSHLLLITATAQLVQTIAWAALAVIYAWAVVRFMRGRARHGDVMRTMLCFIALRTTFYGAAATLWPTLSHVPPLGIAVRLTGHIFSLFVAALAVRMVELKARIGHEPG